jgi:hypothetical protein
MGDGGDGLLETVSPRKDAQKVRDMVFTMLLDA